MKTFNRPFDSLPEIARLLYFDLAQVADVNGNVPVNQPSLRKIAVSLSRRRRQIERAAYYLHACGFIRFYLRQTTQVFAHLMYFSYDTGRFPFVQAPPWDPERDRPEYLPSPIRTVSRHYRYGQRLCGAARRIPIDLEPPEIRPGPEEVMCFTKPPRGVKHRLSVNLQTSTILLRRPAAMHATGPYVRGTWWFVQRGRKGTVYHVQPHGFVAIGHGSGSVAAAIQEALQPLSQGKEIKVSWIQ